MGNFNHPSSMKVDIIHFIMICDGSESTNIPRTCKSYEPYIRVLGSVIRAKKCTVIVKDIRKK